jgi:hypothetical protein
MLMVQIFMTLNGTVSSVLCGNGRVAAVFHGTASDVISGYFKSKPIPAHENGVAEMK